MSQATNWSVPLSGPVTPTVMAQRIDDSLNALLSQHRGASRPSYAVAGTVWAKTIDASESQIYYFDGSNDIYIGKIDRTDQLFYPAGHRIGGTSSGDIVDLDTAQTLANKDFDGLITITGNVESAIISTVDTGREYVVIRGKNGSGNTQIIIYGPGDSTYPNEVRIQNGAVSVQNTLDVGGGTAKRVAPAGTYVTDSDYPVVSQTSLLLQSIGTSWESVGPTGSGATNIWTALDAVPDNAKWIRVRIWGTGTCNDADSGRKETRLNARPHGSSISPHIMSCVFTMIGGGGGGYATAGNVCEATINFDSNLMFDLILSFHDFSSAFSGNICLIGWDFNPPS